MLPNLEKLTLRTGTDLFHDIDAERNINDFLVTPLPVTGTCGKQLTCVVHYGSEGSTNFGRKSVMLDYIDRSSTPMKYTRSSENWGDLIETTMRFRFRGSVDIDGIVREFCFPQLGLGPGWTELMKTHDDHDEETFEPHMTRDYIPSAKTVEGFKDERGDMSTSDEYAANKARGADTYAFELDPRKIGVGLVWRRDTQQGMLTSLADKGGFDKTRDSKHGYDKDSIVYDKGLWVIDGTAQVLLAPESIKTRHREETRDSYAWRPKGNLDLPGSLKVINLEITFRHKPSNMQDDEWVQYFLENARKKKRDRNM